ncbi:prepilin peptidase [bacterium]|nr:prepilin peptidase [bacterium]
MMAILFIVAFLTGLAFGSFLNCLIYRLHNHKTILGRSFCPKCGQKIRWYDNIPIVSFIFLKARCRSCHKRISWQYPVTELIMGLFFALSIWLHIEELSLLVVLRDWVVFSTLLFIFVYDLKYSETEDVVLLPATALVLIFSLLLGQSFASIMFSALIGVSFFGIQYLITKGRGIGFGDLRIGFFMGIVCGNWQYLLVALFFAYIIGALISLILMLRGRKKMKSAIPLGPFLAIGTLMAFLFGDKIITLYLG